MLLQPVVVQALRAAITQAGPPARLVRGVVLEVALGGGPPADRAGAGGVPDLGQVPQPDPADHGPGLSCRCSQSPGSTRVSSATIQVRPGSRGAQPPGAVVRRAARPGRAGVNGRREPGPARRPGSGSFPVALGFGPGAAVPDGVPVLVGDGHAPGRRRVLRGGGGQVAGQPRVDRADARTDSPGRLASTGQRCASGTRSA